MADATRTTPARREPPPFRRVEVLRIVDRTPRLRRITLGGPELAGFDPRLPAASCRLLIAPVGGNLEIPTWTGNLFHYADRTRATIRTLTPLRFDAEVLELDVEVVLHGSAPLSTWAAEALPGTRTAVSGSGRGYEVDPEVSGFLLAGDESALPAIQTLLEAIPRGTEVETLVEVDQPEAQIDLPGETPARWLERSAGEAPGATLGAVVTEVHLAEGTRVWAAGEAAAMQAIRKHLFDERELPRDNCTVRGYWKHGRGES